MFIFWLSLEENRNFRVMDGEALLAFINPRDYRIFRIKEWVQFGLFFWRVTRFVCFCLREMSNIFLNLNRVTWVSKGRNTGRRGKYFFQCKLFKFSFFNSSAQDERHKFSSPVIFTSSKHFRSVILFTKQENEKKRKFRRKTLVAADDERDKCIWVTFSHRVDTNSSWSMNQSIWVN